MLVWMFACAVDPNHEVVAFQQDTAAPVSEPAQVLAPATGCSVDDSAFGSIDLWVSGTVETVVEAVWTDESPGDTYLVFAADGEALRYADAEAGPQEGMRAMLFGLKADTDYDVQIVREHQGSSWCSEPRSVRTGSLPADLPALDIETFHEDVDGYLIAPVHTWSGGGWILILDGDGDVVWYRNGGHLRARLSRDGRAVITNDFANDAEQHGTIQRTELDGSGTSTVEVLGAHMDVVELETGRYATFGWETEVEADGTLTVLGETLLEVDADGEVTEVWRASDELVPDANVQDPSGNVDDAMWAHLNHLEYDRSEDAYYVVSRSLRAVYRIPRHLGTIDWTLAASKGDFQPADNLGQLEFNPHSAVPTDDGVLIFDTGSTRSDFCSAAIEYTLDDEAMTARQTWTYATDACLVTDYLGNAVHLSDGHRLLVLAMSGLVDEVDEEGTLLQRVQVPDGGWVSYATKVPSLGG